MTIAVSGIAPSWKLLLLLGKIAIGIKIVAVSAGYMGWAIFAPTAAGRRHKFLTHAEEVALLVTQSGKMSSLEYAELVDHIARLRLAADQGWFTLDQQSSMLAVVRFVSLTHAQSTKDGVSEAIQNAYQYMTQKLFAETVVDDKDDERDSV